MGAICLIDTSIFLEVLNVPQKANQHKFIMELLKEKINEGGNSFFAYGDYSRNWKSYCPKSQ